MSKQITLLPTIEELNMERGGLYHQKAGRVRVECLFFGYEEDGGGFCRIWTFDLKYIASVR